MKRNILALLYSALFSSLLFYSCGGEENASISNKSITKKETSKKEEVEVFDSPPTVFELLTPEQSGVKFANKVVESNEANIFEYEYMYNGSGVGVGDINNDGLEDLFFTGNMVDDRLYLNKGNLKFQNISKKAGVQKTKGWSTGVNMVDINQDGWLDIYVCRSGPFDNPVERTNLLYINNGDLTFTESAKEYGLDYTGYSSQSAFLDYDKDGDLDMYLLTHPDDFIRKMNSVKLKEMEKNGTIEIDHFFVNNNGKFEDRTKQAGILSSGYGLGVSISDINNDGWQDVYVSNDYAQGDYMWINNQDGTFTNDALNRLKHTSQNSMGCDIADVNNDGHLDLMTVDMAFEGRERSKRNMASMDPQRFYNFVKMGWNYCYMRNTLQINNGMGAYNDVAEMVGLSVTDWSWSPLIADFDNDGKQDIFVCNGYKKDVVDNDFRNELAGKKGLSLQETLDAVGGVKMKNHVYKNEGDLKFKEKNVEWGLREKVNSNGAAYADLDNDGDLDLIINNLESKAFIYKNIVSDSNKGNALTVELEDSPKNLGTRVVAKVNGKKMIREYHNIRGYLSSMGQKLHFGLGENNTVDSLIVYWPNGDIRLLKNVSADEILKLSPSAGEKVTADQVEPKVKPMLKRYNNEAKIKYVHEENDYNDFNLEILLPHRMSENGPHVSKGDINGDGLEDLFVGGAKDQAPGIYFQNAAGDFTRSAHPTFDQDKGYEDMGSVIFDANGDGLMDVYVVSGGNERPSDDAYYQDRLYINQGGGKIVKSNNIPTITSSGSRVIALDYDKDGDQDLIVGGRVKGQNYPRTPKSYLLQNDNGAFTDVTEQVIPGFQDCGMVTDFKPMDYDGDGDQDLLVVGEWMAPKMFQNEGSSFKDVSETVLPKNKEGWWFSVTTGDFDGDGDLDFAAGNIGMNNKFHPSEKKPFKVYASDFDDNGTHDIVLAKYDGDVIYPLRGKECSTDQMPFVSQKFPTYEGFAKASLEDVYTKEKLALAFSREVKEFHSGIFINNNGKFEYKELPRQAQMSCIQDMVYTDVNNDNINDLIVVGNIFGAEVETTKYDASDGLVMLGDGKGNFDPVPGYKSGLNVPFNTRDLELVETNNSDKLLLVTASNGPVSVYKIN